MADAYFFGYRKGSGLNERINDDNWCVDAHGNVSRNGTRLCGPDGLDKYVPIVRRLLAAWWAAQPPCSDPIVGEWHGHLVSRCHRCGYPMQCGWPHRCKVAASKVRPAPRQYTWEQAEAGMRRGEIWVAKHPAWAGWREFRFVDNDGMSYFELRNPPHWISLLVTNECTWRPYSEVTND